MERRLYFLLPDVAHARAVVADLETNGVERKYTHVIAAQGIDLEGLPLALPLMPARQHGTGISNQGDI
ncbi:MAG TPA: hypothetical protein ENJ12_10135 [Thiolapillus brandeum]|uniref:Uncharacterized protein n=1 Tax=Thiolapillus brandeum TaxID=1076588 RepID=A0A831WB64_9GAMM|nr:hypothetical protein [Thiolapillus brandeum]